MALEQPKYRVVRSIGAIEIREYEPYWVAECDLSDVSDLNLASNAGFRRLFNYISGENASSQKIAMTVPVRQVPSKNGWAVSFVVPRIFYKDGVPQPTNSKVQVREVPGGRVAALRYRGLWNSGAFAAQSKRLLDGLAAEGIRSVGEVFSAVYNPPLTPPFLRRNEVLVAISEARTSQNY